MTLTVPPALADALTSCAASRNISFDEVVHEALAWYVQIGPELLDELTAWREIHDEALQITMDSIQ